MDDNFSDSSGHQSALQVSGQVGFSDNTTWMAERSGKVGRFGGIGNRLTVMIPRTRNVLFWTRMVGVDAGGDSELGMVVGQSGVLVPEPAAGASFYREARCCSCKLLKTACAAAKEDVPERSVVTTKHTKHTKRSSSRAVTLQ